METDKERQELLVKLGFRSFSHYQRSDLWSEIRATIFERDGYQCQARRCSGRAFDIGFLDWKPATVLGCEPASMLTLCNECYLLAYKTDDGFDRNLQDTRNKLLELRLGVKIQRGRSCPQIGNFYRNVRQQNEKTKTLLQDRLKNFSLATITKESNVSM